MIRYDLHRGKREPLVEGDVHIFVGFEDFEVHAGLNAVRSRRLAGGNATVSRCRESSSPDAFCVAAIVLFVVSDIACVNGKTTRLKVRRRWCRSDERWLEQLTRLEVISRGVGLAAENTYPHGTVQEVIPSALTHEMSAASAKTRGGAFQHLLIRVRVPVKLCVKQHVSLERATAETLSLPLIPPGCT